MPCQHVCEEGRSKITNSVTFLFFEVFSHAGLYSCCSAEVGANLIPQHRDKPGGEKISVNGEIK